MSVIRKRWLVIALHVAVILGLVGTTAVMIYADGYFNRGVAAGPDLAPVAHTGVNPLGVNTFLNEEADPSKVERELDMIAAAGFTFVRQMFAWYEIEPAPGVYVDPNHGVDTWAKYDRIVDLATERGLEIIARLDKPPAWAREGQENVDTIPDGPPNDDADYANFVANVVRRYKGRINYIQIWNEPNLEGEWGGQPIDPARFTQLLKAAYVAAKEVDPTITVLMPGLAPTDQTGPTNLSELLFLQGMYDAGAKDYFDIATAMIYGYGYSPWDRRVDFKRNNFSRVIQLREVMERNGDGDKPVWAAEYGWVALPPDWDGEPSPWGEPVTPEQQAEYLYEGYLRAREEWPWLGAMCVWNFRQPSRPDAPNQIGNPTRGFSIVKQDFTPTPAYELLARARGRLDRAFTGVHPANSRWVSHDGDRLTITFSGPRLDLLLEGSGDGFRVSIDGEPVREIAPGDAARVTIADGLADGPHTATIEGLGASRTFAGFVVVRTPLTSWIFPWIYASLAVVLALNIGSLVWVARDAAGRPEAKAIGLPCEASEEAENSGQQDNIHETQPL